MASEYAHCYGGDASREYLSVEDATTNGGDASRVGKRCSICSLLLLFGEK